MILFHLLLGGWIVGSIIGSFLSAKGEPTPRHGRSRIGRASTPIDTDASRKSMRVGYLIGYPLVAAYRLWVGSLA